MSQWQKWSTSIGAFGIALIVGAFLLGIVTPTRRDILLLLGGLGVVLLAFYFIMRPRDATRQKSDLRIASQGGKALLIVAVGIGVVVAVNFIVEKQYSQRFDVTANQHNTLSPQTVQILKNLQEPIQVTGFFSPQTIQLRQEAERLLKNYQEQTDKVVVQYVDPNENPALAQQYDNVFDGTLVFEKGKRTEKVSGLFDENAFTNAILQVTQTSQPAIYFTTGHGEYEPSDFEQDGLSAVVDYLKQTNYKVETLNLTTISETLPADTSALVIAGATKKFSPENDLLLKNYLQVGGRILLLSQPNTDIGLNELLKAGGVELENNLILDPANNYYGNAPIPVFSQFPEVPVTENMRGLAVYFPGVRSIKELEDSEVDVTPLFTTTPDACAKTDFEKMQGETTLECDAGDVKGTYTVGYAIEGAGTGGANPGARARMIVLGNASFAANQALNNADAEGNKQLIRNMVNWLAGQEELIAIPPRDSDVRPLTALTGNEIMLIFWSSVALIPLAALVIGGLLWWRKR